MPQWNGRGRASLELVFGESHVYFNVEVLETKGNTLEEIDVLVAFGNRAIVLQAKSKRLSSPHARTTTESTKALSCDFKEIHVLFVVPTAILLRTAFQAREFLEHQEAEVIKPPSLLRLRY